MAPNPSDSTVDKDAIIASLVEQTRMLQSKVESLEGKIKHGEAFDTTFEASQYSRGGVATIEEIPDTGMPAKHVVRHEVPSVVGLTTNSRPLPFRLIIL